MKLSLKGEFIPLGREGVKIDVHITNQYQQFQINDIEINIIAGSHQIVAIRNINADSSIIEYFKDTGKLILRSEGYESLLTPLYETVQNVVSYLKYFYGIYEIDEDIRLSQRYLWSLDAVNFLPIPDKRLTAWRGTNIVYTLDDNLLSWMSILSDRNIKPFFAFTHLHKAFAETDTRHQWINATIAAELSFKEFIIQFDGKTSSLITYTPSPPLDILYDKVLKDFTNETSPYAKILIQGASLRNKLIHRSTEPSPQRLKTFVYLHEVQASIFHLYTLLYKDDSFFKYLYNHALGKLEWAKKQKL